MLVIQPDNYQVFSVAVKKLCFASEWISHVRYLQLSFQFTPAELLPTQVLRRTLGKAQPGHELNGKSKGWRQR